ncbi:MAG: hypothetical protein Q8P22_01275 [Chloroflexota bacterium]|nr:hypothetical protein [Chloroflexota bacterium]
MGDGHYGLENRDTSRLGVGRFLLALGYLIQDAATAYFVIHIRPTGGYISELTSQRFLELLGYTHFPGQCPFFQADCYYRYVYESPIDRENRDPLDRKVEYAHKRFRDLAEALPGIYEQVHDIYIKLGHIPDLFPALRGYGPQPLPDFSQEAPPWIDKAKVAERKEIEEQLERAVERHKYFSTVEYILWGSGDQLEEAVHLVLEDLGLEVHRTPKGSTIDRLVRLPQSDVAFGVEITGLNDAIKKKSNKITQALTFLQEREGSERPVIIANTFNDLPLEERAQKEHFTPEALALLKPSGIAALTTVTLYEIWKAVKYDGADIRSIAQDLYNHPGGEFPFPRP